MRALVLFLVVAALSLVASSRALLQAGRVFGLAQLSASGMLFLVFGVLAGPLAMGVVGPTEAEQLRPLLAVGLAVAGVLVGLNLDPRLLQALPFRVYLAAGAQSLTTAVLVAGALFVPLWLGLEVRRWVAAGAAALLGAVASVSSPHFVILGVRSGLMERRAGLAITVVAMLDDLFGILALVVALSVGVAATLGAGLGLVGLAAALGMLCGLLLAFLARAVRQEEELVAILLGAVLLVGGAAAYLHLSTLVLGVACGFTLSLVGGASVQRTWRVLARMERPVYLLLLFLAGPLLTLTSPLVWALLPAFVAVRFLGKVAGGVLARRAGAELALPRQVGWALVSQGGLSVCLVLEYLLLVPRASSHLLFDVALLGALLNELLAAQAFRTGFPSLSPLHRGPLPPHGGNSGIGPGSGYGGGHGVAR
jgi:hypothetical protein